MDVSSSDPLSLAKNLLVRIVCLRRTRFSKHPCRERDPPSDFILGGEINDVSKGFRVLVPARFGERTGLGIDGDALSSPLLVFLPKRFDRFLRNAKDGLDWRDESNRLVRVVFAVIALILVIIGTIDNLLQTPPIQGLIPVSTAPP